MVTEHDTCNYFILKEKLNENLRKSEDFKDEYFKETGIYLDITLYDEIVQGMYKIDFE